MFSEVTTRRKADAVFDQVPGTDRRRQPGTGTTLPAERELAAQLNVSRQRCPGGPYNGWRRQDWWRSAMVDQPEWGLPTGTDIEMLGACLCTPTVLIDAIVPVVDAGDAHLHRSRCGPACAMRTSLAVIGRPRRIVDRPDKPTTSRQTRPDLQFWATVVIGSEHRLTAWPTTDSKTYRPMRARSSPPLLSPEPATSVGHRQMVSGNSRR